MKLSEVLKIISYKESNIVDSNVLFTNISCDSRNIKEGGLFVAIRGESDDGGNYIKEAVKNGAVAVIIDKNSGVSIPESVSYIIVNNVREEYAKLASLFFDYPSRHIKVIGITGTNGKTTIAFLIQHILKSHAPCGMLSTIIYDTGRQRLDAGQTTPDAYYINQFLKEMIKNKCKYCVMEVSSHALSQSRVDHLNFDAAIFTNLTQDHLDYHTTMEEYFLSKLRLFKEVSLNKLSFINIDSDYGKRLISELPGKYYTYGINRRADFKADQIHSDLKGLSFNIHADGKCFRVRSPLICLHNVYNILAAFSYTYNQGIDPHDIVKAINEFSGVVGRLESVYCGQPFHVYIDYAHTPDAFHNVFSSIKDLKKGKIITVFGCGGNRDRTKRPLMGSIASKYSNNVIITNDNPRFEDEGTIHADIIKGLSPRDGFQYEVIPERKIAIEKAILMANPDDIVLILGKGHEEYMIKGKEKIVFSDRKVAKEILEGKFSNASVK